MIDREQHSVVLAALLHQYYPRLRPVAIQHTPQLPRERTTHAATIGENVAQTYNHHVLSGSHF